MPDTKPDKAELPRSIEGHTIPEPRLALIRPHVATLAETALAVSKELPFQADIGDFVAVLEKEEG
jgi:hypothetical protein